MNVEISIDAAKALLRLNKGAKRMGYAAVNAINTTAKAVQQAEQEQVGRAFTLRGSAGAFVRRRSAVIKPFASVNQGRFEARVRVDTTAAPRLLLPQYEAGFTRMPSKGRSVAVPVGARPTKAASVPPELFISRLQLRHPVTGRRAPRKAGPGAPARRGLLRTFVVRGVGVVQRVSKGTTRLLYSFVAPFRVAPRLQFQTTARRIIARDFAANLKRQIDETFGRHA